jgi:hypothetical protein
MYKSFGDFDAAMDFVHRYGAASDQLKESSAEEVQGSNFWYAVINPSQSFYHIYPSWPEAMPHVTGVKGATCKKYRSYDEARRVHVESATAEVGDARGRFAKKKMEEVSKGGGKVTAVSEYYPPDVLVGPDPSIGNEDAFFEIDVNMGESELRAALCPSDMTEAVSKGLMNATIDVVSMPGGFFGGEVSQASSELGVLGRPWRNW